MFSALHAKILFAALLVAYVGLASCQQDDCDIAKDRIACSQRISQMNGLFCNWISSLSICRKSTTLCETCYAPMAGVCAPTCTSAAACANDACPSACSQFLSGWSSNVCERFQGGGVCERNGGCATLDSIQPASRATLCTAARSRATEATCGSTGCKRSGSCEPGAPPAASYCHQFGGAACAAQQHCDITGSCVANSVCDNIDRLSDCTIVPYPGNNRMCVRGIHGCDTPVGAIVAPSMQNGCAGHGSKLACEASTCARNGGKCAWVDFRSSLGTCVCPNDCPPCSSLVNGVCQWDCANADGCAGFTCPRSLVKNTPCFFPSLPTTVVTGMDGGSCVCHLPPVGGCASGAHCDIDDECATNTDCNLATDASTCAQLTCPWDQSACQWAGTLCRCGSATPVEQKASTLPQVYPVRTPTARLSGVACTDALDCPPLLGVTISISNSRSIGGAIGTCVNELFELSPSSRECFSFSNDGQSKIQLALPTASVVNGFALQQSYYGPCLPTIWAVDANGAAVSVVVNTTTLYDQPRTWSLYAFAPVHTSQLFLRCNQYSSRSYVGLAGIRIFGWNEDVTKRVSNWSISQLGVYNFESTDGDGTVVMPMVTGPTSTTFQPFATTTTGRTSTTFPLPSTVATTGRTSTTSPLPSTTVATTAAASTPSTTSSIATGTLPLATAPASTLSVASNNNGVDDNTADSDSASTDIALFAGIAGGIGGVLLLVIVAAVAAMLIYRNKLAKANFRNSQLLHSNNVNMSIQRNDSPSHGIYDRVPDTPDKYSNALGFVTGDTVFTELHHSEVGSVKRSDNAAH